MNILRKSIIALMAVISFDASAGDHIVGKFSLIGPYAVHRPVLIDSVDVMGKTYDETSLLRNFLPIRKDAKTFKDEFSTSLERSVAQLSFEVEVTSYLHATLKTEGLTDKLCFLDGKESDGKNVTLSPGNHIFEIRALFHGPKMVRPKVIISVDNDKALSFIEPYGKRFYNVKDVLNGRRYSGAQLSSDGHYAIIGYTDTHTGGSVDRYWEVKDLFNHNVMGKFSSPIQFFPGSNDILLSKTSSDNQKQLVRVSMDSGMETMLVNGLPKKDDWQITPDGNSLILSHVNEGKKEDKEIYQILEPDDRQPDWRDRVSLLKMDIATGVIQPLTFGYHNCMLLDISGDSRYALFMTSRSRLTSRPTTLYSLWRLDMQNMHAECLVQDDGFIASAKFSPNGEKLVIMGSPECLGGVGRNLPEGRIPSMYDYQLYTLDLVSKTVKPLTKYFNPGVADFQWSKKDDKIWFTALDKDYCHLYKCDPQSGEITKIAEPEDMVSSFDLSDSADCMVWYGEGASNSDRLYTLNTESGTSTLIEDLNSDILKDVELGKCEPWTFVNGRGDSISCRYYLPPHFNAAKKYPVIVNYYGGCSPTSRDFESRYPQHVYASYGYVVLVVNPSGAVGWGQEFSSRHVNTAGRGVAEDIIEATQLFCRSHSWTDSLHVGCIGASYGGFMTQYLQTKTNIFAAAISHAGISDHTSYWGEGYWGYSYSEVSMAGSYPWTRRDLYVDQSPLFNADKIHTPLLFLHGSADHNVPIGESIQMFTALKLLGRPTAFVVVEGQDHHILDYNKRLKWQSTILAWFQKYLKEDPSWWDAIYKPTPLNNN